MNELNDIDNSITSTQPNELLRILSQPAFTCSKSTIETLEEYMKSVQS